jgi:hypothetical protein
VVTGKATGRLGSKEDDVAQLALSPDGKFLVSRDVATLVRVWDQASGKKIRTYTFKREDAAFGAVSLSPDGKVLAKGGESPTVRFLDLATGKEQGPLAIEGANPVYLCFSPDGKTLAVVARGDDKVTVHVWDMVTKKEVTQFVGEYGVLDRVGFSPDGRVLAVGGHNNRMIFLEVASGKQILRFPIPDDLRATAFAPDGKTLATGGGDDLALLIWDLRELARATPTSPARLTEKELALFWDELAELDAGRAYRSHWLLAGSPERAVSLIRKRLLPFALPDTARVKRLLTRLGDARYRTRKKATKELEILGEVVEPDLLRVLWNEPGPEVAQRVRRLLQKIENQRRRPSAEQLRQIRAVGVLEQIGTADARRLLRKLVGGAPGARLTREAQASCQRLAMKKAKKP